MTLRETIVGEEECEVDLLALDQALERLARLDPRLARVVECKYFVGLTDREIAAELGLTTRTIRSDWKRA